MGSDGRGTCGRRSDLEDLWTDNGPSRQERKVGKWERGAAWWRPLSQCMSGGVLLSHNLSVAVPSALKGLTSGFGMGPGVSRFAMAAVTLSTCQPPRLGVGFVGWELLSGRERCPVWAVCSSFARGCVWFCTVLGQALGLLVPVGWALLLYTSGLSTPCSVGGLTHLCGGKPHLETCFPLRCIQRLSLPNVANQPCPWRDNWHTRGSSIPVLSY